MNNESIYNPSGINEQQYLAIQILNSIISALAISGCIILTLTYRFVRESRTFAFRLIIYLTFAESLYSLSNLINIFQLTMNNPYSLCVIQGFLRSAGIISGLMVASFMAWCLYRTAVLNATDINKKEKKHLVLTLIITIAFSCL